MANYIYGCKKDTPDSRDYIYIPKVKIEELPEKIDLREQFSDVVDQGQLGSCTANAIVSGLRQYQLLKQGTSQELSRLFLYYKERELEGTIQQDSGAQISDGMKVLQQIGVCPEVDFPYNITKFTNPPTPQSLIDAQPYKIAEYHRVTSLDLLKAALTEGLPVILGVDVYTSFEGDSATQSGIIPMPDLNKEQLLGGHAICACGYDDNDQVVIFRNSWGILWGDLGYGYLHYDYFKDHVSDMWTSIDSETPKKEEEDDNTMVTTETNTGSFSITVIDAVKAPIVGATITYIVGAVSTTDTTDSTGNVTVTGLPADNYTITVSDTNYVSNTTTLAISNDTVTSATIILSVTLASVVESLLTQLAAEKTTLATSLFDGIIAKLEAEEKSSSSWFVRSIRDPIELALVEQLESGTIPALADILVTVLTKLINTKLGAIQK